jgi:hypothetical protein
MHGHHGEDDDNVEEPSARPRPVPLGFVDALSDALHRRMPGGVVSSIEMWEGQERVGINFRDVSNQERVIDAVSDALSAIDTKFEYFPSIDISIWKH